MKGWKSEGSPPGPLGPRARGMIHSRPNAGSIMRRWPSKFQQVTDRGHMLWIFVLHRIHAIATNAKHQVPLEFR